MAFDSIFQGPPEGENAPGTAQSPSLGVDVVNKELYISAGEGWEELGGGGGGGNLSGTLTSGIVPIASAAHTLVDGPIDYDVSLPSTLTIQASESGSSELALIANNGIFIDTNPGDWVAGVGGGPVSLASGAGITLTNGAGGITQIADSVGGILLQSSGPTAAVQITNAGNEGTLIEDSGGGGITAQASGGEAFLSFLNSGPNGTYFDDTGGGGLFVNIDGGSSSILFQNHGTGGTEIEDAGGGGIVISNAGGGGIAITNHSGGVGTSITDISGSGILIDPGSANVTIGGVIIPKTVYSAAGTPLPAASSGLTGARAFVSDAMANVYGTTYSSGGSTKAPVYCDGTNWIMG